MKDTALASVVAMPDLLKQATQAQALAANPTPLIGAAIIYVLILLPFVRLVARVREAPGAEGPMTRPIIDMQAVGKSFGPFRRPAGRRPRRRIQARSS